VSVPGDLAAAVRRIVGEPPRAATPLGGGCVGDVFRLDFADRAPLVAKMGDPGAGLDVEGFMLEALAELSALPVPVVFHADETLLLMDWIEADDPMATGSQEHAAELLAALHGISTERFGFPRDTRIGGLVQPNAWCERWLDFFRDRRLLHRGRAAHDAGRLPSGMLSRLESLAARVGDWIGEPAAPALLHGDAWDGNILCRSGRVAAFIDPAIYYGDPEIELAFGTLFGTFGAPFFRRYEALRPLAPGFHDERRDLYNLYPLLVHVQLFGGGYVSSVDATLRKFGF
jgi:fructosamine-3-kinase